MIPAFSLKRQLEALSPEISQVLEQMLVSGQFILGPAVARFEAEMARWLGVAETVGVGNGSDALYLALLALGVGPGDDVVTTAFTFFATAGSIARTGAKPVFTDIDLDTFNMEPAMALSCVTPRTRVILPVHLFGLMADVRSLCRGFSGSIVEDAAQAIGARQEGRLAGTVGDAGCFSFFPTKNLGALGDGGLVSVHDEALGRRVRRLRVHGAEQKYLHRELGVNSRLDAIQAAVLAIKLPRLEQWTRRRQAIARRYSEGLRDLGVDEVVPPRVPAGFDHVFHQYTIRAERRDALKAFLDQNSVGSTVYYPVPLHRQPALADAGGILPSLPHSETAARTVLSLPMFPELNDDEVDRVVECIGRFFGKRR